MNWKMQRSGWLMTALMGVLLPSGLAAQGTGGDSVQELTERLAALAREVSLTSREAARIGVTTDARSGGIDIGPHAPTPKIEPQTLARLERRVHRLRAQLEPLYAAVHGRWSEADPASRTFALLEQGHRDVHRLDLHVRTLERVVQAARVSVEATTTPPGASTVSSEAAGSISGSVTEEGSGTPLQGIVVEIYDSTGGWSTSGTTDASGNYQSSLGLPTGTYYACTSNELGYVNETYDDIQSVTSCSDPTSGTPISVTDPSETSGIDFALEPGGGISGSVTEDGSGTPLENVFVSFFAAGTFVTAASDTTDVSGNYSVAGLPTGTYYACTHNDQGYIDEIYDDVQGPCDLASGTPIDVTAPSETGGINFALELGGSISGSVTEDGSGTPLMDVDVDVYDSTGDWLTRDSTDASGNYSVIGLATGTYYACTFNNQSYTDETYDDILGCVREAGTPIGVAAGIDTGGIDFALALNGSISGTVTEDGSGLPLQDISVGIYDSAGDSVSSRRTDASGSYSVGGLVSGTYYACASDFFEGHVDERYDDMPVVGFCDPTLGTAISVNAPAETAGIDFALAPGGGITGTVIEVGTGTPLSVSVDLYDSGGTFLDGGRLSGADGTFTYDSLPSGNYFIWSWPFSDGYYGEAYENHPCESGCTVTDASAISVVAPIISSSINLSLMWETGCKPDLLLDGPPIEDDGLILQGCNNARAQGPFGIPAGVTATIEAGGPITLGDGFFVEQGATLRLRTELLCGNGVLDTTEQCDDGNNSTGDGCDSICRLE